MERLEKLLVFGYNKCLDFVANQSKRSPLLLLLLTLFFVPRWVQGATGEEVYNKMCMSCHSLTDEVLMGPGLAGLSDRRTEAWILSWVKDSQGFIKSGDKDAVAIFKKFNEVPMPGFPQLSDDEIKALIAFVNEKGAAAANAPEASTGTAPAPATNTTATPSGGIFDIKINGVYLFWTLLGAAIIGLLLYRFRKNTFKNVNEAGYFSEPHYTPNYTTTLFLFILIAAVLIYILIVLLNQNYGMVNNLMFLVLPYLSFGVFLAGSIYRYTSRGFQVSSLSSQFLEGKKLFWGSLPFHWGLVVLFLGHLIAFMFPSAVLAWNGQPIRLLILEISSFAFGLSALFGLILLIKRRLEAKMLLVVTNKMDMVVYTVLFTQIISGLGVAFFVRWGSSWFSSVLTPYLRSIFMFNPDINAVSEMPWLIQIHIISAFVIIGIIPFTRFMHFLVAPFDYAWRKYQLVIWNWNPKNIRTSIRHNFGKRPRNH